MKALKLLTWTYDAESDRTCCDHCSLWSTSAACSLLLQLLLLLLSEWNVDVIVNATRLPRSIVHRASGRQYFMIVHCLQFLDSLYARAQTRRRGVYYSLSPGSTSGRTQRIVKFGLWQVRRQITVTAKATCGIVAAIKIARISGSADFSTRRQRRSISVFDKIIHYNAKSRPKLKSLVTFFHEQRQCY